MTDEEVMRELGSQSTLDNARKAFRAEVSRFAKMPPRPSGYNALIELRRQEFEAVRRIAEVLGVKL